MAKINIGKSKLSGSPEKALSLKLKKGSVTNEKLADKAVTSGKIANNAITSEKVANGQLNWAHLDKDTQNIIASVLDEYHPISIQGDVINAPDEEDLTTTILEGTETIKFKDKLNAPAHFSGYGRKYLRKNIIREAVVEKLGPTIFSVADPEVAPGKKTPATIDDAMEAIQSAEERAAARITHAYWDLRAGEGGVAVLYDRDTTNESTIAGHWSVGYIVLPVNAGETIKLTANFKSSTANANAGYFWAIIDNSSKKHIIQCDETVSDDNIAIHSQIYVVESGLLVINHIAYQNPPYTIHILSKTGKVRNFNILPTLEEENTIYKIQYDYDLNGRNISFPENSILQFEGGSIRNAYIEGNNTLIIAAETDDIFGRNTELTGSWKNDDWYPKWFGAYQDGETDDTEILQKIMNLAPALNRKICLRLGNHAYRTTKGLILKDNVYIYNGTINAKFDNPLDWVIQTEALYSGKLTSYRAFGGWKAFDSGVLKHCGPCYIEGLTINGELNEHKTDGEWDGTYCPIFGGIRMQSGVLPTVGVRINNVGYGFARSCSLNSYDRDIVIHACFSAYCAFDVNNVTVYDSYFTAHSHYKKSSPGDTQKVVPFYPEYHGLVKITTYTDGNGGWDDSIDLVRPKYCLVRMTYARMGFTNFTTDGWSEVAFAVGEESKVCVQNAWLEAVTKAYLVVGGNWAKATFINTAEFSAPEFDLYCGPKDEIEITLIGSGITCSGYGDNEATIHKFFFVRYFEPTINVLGPRTNDYPNLYFWHFLEGDDVYINMVGDERASRYTILPYGSNGRYSNVFTALMNSHKYFKVAANTKVVLPYRYISCTSLKVIQGASRVTSSIVLNSFWVFKNCDITFDTLTVDIGKQIITTGSKFVFKNCNIIGFLDDNRGSSKSTYYFENCTFIPIPKNNRYFAFGGEEVSIVNCLFNPYVRYNKALLGNDYLTKVDYHSTSGPESARNLISWHAASGTTFFNTEKNREELWNGRLWGSLDGYPFVSSRGSISQRPSLPGMQIGTKYKDTDNDITYELVSNGTCGYGLFAFDVRLPKVSRSIYIGRTLVEAVDGDFSTDLPAGTYPVYCIGYECSPASITVQEGMAPVSIRTKASIYTTTYTVTIYALDASGDAIDNLNIMVGGYSATRVVTSKGFQGYYTATVLNGTYLVTAAEYTESGEVIVNGANTSVTVTLQTERETIEETVAVAGSILSVDSIENANGDTIQAGTYTVSLDETTLDVAITEDDINLILYSIDYSPSELNRQFAYLLMRKWFEAGHYAEFANGAKLYTDTVGNSTGALASFTDSVSTPTNLLCTVTSGVGTEATWEEV